MRLYISGNKHASLSDGGERNRLQNVFDQGVDVVFEEGRNETASNREMWWNLVAAPVLFLTLFAYTLVLAVLQTLFQSDIELRDDLVKQHEIETVKVDRPFHEMITPARKLWAVFTVVTIFPILWAVALRLVFGIVLMFTALAIVANLVAFVAGTAASRNMAMVMNVSQVARERDYDTAVLFVGDEHKSEIETLFKKYSVDVTIVRATE